MNSRRKVIWRGTTPPSDFAEKLGLFDLELDANPNLGIDRRDAALANARALILAVTRADDPELTKAQEGLFARAETHGLSLHVVAPLEAVPQVEQLFADLDRRRRPQVLTIEALESALKAIFATAGPAYDGNVEIGSSGSGALSDEEKILLRRAFHDAKEIRLTKLEGGASAKVFKAFAVLRDSRAGPQPLPFFVKFDRRPKIGRELSNYSDCTALFIPFWARPNIDVKRCALGHERGVLVGNFVEFSHSLTDHVRDGTAIRPIHSLFEDALRGWRRQAFLDPKNKKQIPLAQSFGGAVYANLVDQGADRARAIARSAQKFGAERDAEQLRAAIDGLPPIEHRCAQAHCDLHADNVQVRDGQAILIDFASTANAPLAMDPASLDTSLVLRSDETAEPIWKRFVDDIYSLPALQALPAPGQADAPMEHLRDALREIRKIALADRLNPNEYPTAIAICLLRHAFRLPRNNEPPDRRAYLFAAMDKLVRAIEGQ